MINSVQAAIFLGTTDIEDIGAVARKYFPDHKLQMMNVADGVKSELQAALPNGHLLRVSSEPGRLDVFILSPLLPNGPAGELVPFRELFQDIDELIPVIATDVGCVRLSIATQALERTRDATTSAAALADWFHGVQLPKGAGDVEIRFNVPTEFDEITINRNKRFQIVMLQPVSSTGLSLPIETFTVKATDVNTSPTLPITDVTRAWRAVAAACEELLEHGFAE